MTTYDRVRAKITGFFASDLFVDVTITRTTSVFDIATRRTVDSTITIAARGKLDTQEIEGEAGTRSRSTSIIMNVAPLIGDTITLSGEDYTVTRVETEAPDGVAVYHEAFVRA